MAKKGNTLKKSAFKDEFEDKPLRTRKSGSKLPLLPSWVSDGRAVKIAGIFFILLGIYLLFAFSSYLFLYFNWAADDLFSTFSFKSILFDTDVEAEIGRASCRERV